MPELTIARCHACGGVVSATWNPTQRFRDRARALGYTVETGPGSPAGCTCDHQEVEDALVARALALLEENERLQAAAKEREAAAVAAAVAAARQIAAAIRALEG